MIKKETNNKKGFTLIELLIVIAIIAILISVIFTALNPLKRFRDSRDVKRWEEVFSILHAVIIEQIDNKGFYIDAVKNMVPGKVYMVGTATSGCATKNAYCITQVTDNTTCIDLGALSTEYYLGKIPVAPAGSTIWSTSLSGYTIERISSGNITVRACEVEGDGGEISVTH
ncbi:MAG: prepilin-type N-terminal cleavage/methylation domain-containing protein [Candidatus Falkowbacteria bacterium]|nr:prepilin-type N-terminal cleavage/methylation domain-containing protein [Candidatus Falkowbacteria bacterium]